ncbi:GH16464 [Drosophila grimshawi]|uniref:GH16464 n=1 Tax=Drosophila grimshawi TaxID=7222 RepID=B4J0G1_DROGR|nr:GH16464 [Drosophila grimshawi]
MGNKLSCSCAPLMRKAYRYEDSPWQSSRRRDGHLLSSFRLWAEVFHVSASGAGTVKWQQVSEDLVPVNITCIQDSPECIFHITAYNSQVDKILDVRLVQPGTRIGQASECFVYWKDPMTNDTWGLNFTSPIDAKQFRECCSPSFKFSRKASSSYSLKLDPPGKGKVKAKRKPLSTPASPSRVARQEPQCTCMSAEQYARLRTDPRVRGSSTLPRNVGSHRITDVDGQQQGKVVSAVSSTSLYDNVASGGPNVVQGGDTLQRQLKGQEGGMVANAGVNTNTPGVIVTGVGSGSDMCTQNHVGSQVGNDGDAGPCQMDMDLSKSEGTQVGGGLHQSVGTSTKSTGTRSKDFNNDDMTREAHSHDMHHQHNVINNNTRRKTKSTEDMNVDTSTLKRMLKPMPSTESPVTSPEMGRRRYNYYNANAAQTLGPQHMHQHGMGMNAMTMGMAGGGGGGLGGGGHHVMNNNTMGRSSGSGSQSSRFSGSRSSHEIGRGYPPRNLYLELERERERNCIEGSPPSDNVMFDNQCYATTPSSSNGNSDQDQSYGQQQQQQHQQHQQQQQQQQQQQHQQHQQQQQQSHQSHQPHQPHPQQRASRHQHHQHQQAPNVTPTPGSPTSRLLMEYEMHLRNTLAKGMDAESYSLHTFEALLSQSMENLANAKSSTLPLPPHRPLSTIRDKERERDRDGYYSDRNELIRERERERDRGYLSDHNASFSNSRCASCIGESARAQWFRHSDGWRSGSSTIGSGSGHGMMSQQMPGSGHKRSPWDSLPSLRQDSSLNDSGYKSARADSLEQRAEFIRQDSLRSEYLSDRESRYGIVQQASIESTDSRMCYLTSSEQQANNEQRNASETNNNTSNNNKNNSSSASLEVAAAAAAAVDVGSNNSNSSSVATDPKKSFSLHCCCVIVDITPVSHPVARLTTATTASGRDAGAGGSAAGSSSGGGLGLTENVSQLASQLFRFGSKKRSTGVCICNAQCRLQSLGESAAALKSTTHHGSLDRLLQQQQQQLPQKSSQQQQHSSAERSISWVVDGGGAGALLTAASSDESDEKLQQQKKPPPLEEPPPPPRPPARHSVREEFERGVEVEKFYHQINGDIFEITRRVRARDEDTMEQRCIKRKSSAVPHYVRLPEQRPQLPPRRQKSAEEVTMPKSALRQAAPEPQLEWFDRKAQQRHSARSAEGGQVREETIEWLKLQKQQPTAPAPARTSSGPSEITVLKDELPDWLLEHLPRQRERQSSAEKPVSSAYAKALAELLKKPLSRQSSGPCEVSLLKTDIVEWLTKMQSTVAVSGGKSSSSTRRSHHRRNGSSGAAPRSNSQEDQVAAIGSEQVHHATLQRKRHSLGHSNADSGEEQLQQAMPTLEWIAYPLHKLQSLGKQPVSVPSGYDVPAPLTATHTPLCQEQRRREERSRERRLRHSASEVVSSGAGTGAGAGAPAPSGSGQQERLERLYAKPHKERYQYVPKVTPPKDHQTTSSSTTKSKRSRRHQTQRSATVTDMSAQRSTAHKRKSSSAERAPRSRSPSPCTDPACPLLPICTDPHCRYQECQRRRCLTSSASSVNLARHQQLAQVQLHAVPSHLLAGSDITTPSTTATPPPPTATAVAGAQPPQPLADAPAPLTERRLVICHECRSCAPMLSCQNRKCLNAAKCNSLPRCAADFNRLRTTLAQPPTTLDDIEPAPLEMEPPQQQQFQPASPTFHMQHYRSSSQPNTLQRGDSTASSCGMATNRGWLEPIQQLDLYPQQQQQQPQHHLHHALNGNGKLMKSASAASLNSRRRRHKTVHFGENLLREVCQNRKLIKTEQVPSGSAPMKANIQLLYNFVEGVLSAWVDDDEDQVRSGAESEPEHGLVALQPIHRCNRLRYQCIRRVVEEAADLQGTLKLGNSRYRHRHWRSTAKQCNEMFLRKISDDDRMSLTTAVSDEDDGESVMASPYKAKATGTAASSFNCTGAVRKAGFLSVKKWLLRKKHQIELARKRGWKGYWVCLKGTTLLFYPCDSREGRSVEAAPKHLIIVDGAIMQPIPEHPKRDYIFCLSTAFGDAYLFQAPCQVSIEEMVKRGSVGCIRLQDMMRSVLNKPDKVLQA